jgi:hypothetical protein
MIVQHRRTTHRLDQIAARLEILSGYLIAYLNLDEVIRIIRDEDEPKLVMKEKFGLTDNQVEAILNMRRRRLPKLQEIEINLDLPSSERWNPLKGIHCAGVVEDARNYIDEILSFYNFSFITGIKKNLNSFIN